MAYKIKLGNFEKKENSTAQPTTTTWAEYDIVFKDGMDFEAPEVNLKIDYDTAKGYNYAELNNEYFWITGRFMLRTGYCALKLKKDVLATYKSQIGATPLYILRSSAAYNGAIRDVLYPPTANVSYFKDYDETWEPITYDNGYYVVNVSGIDTAGTSTLWLLRPESFKDFISKLYTAIDGFQFSDWSSALTKAFCGSPEKLVSSAMWFPKDFVAGTSREVIVGTWHSGAEGRLISNPKSSLPSLTFDIRKHPQAATKGTYLNTEPFTRYYLYVPYFGGIALDTSKMLNADQIRVFTYIDAISGQGICEVYTLQNGNKIQTLANITAQIGVALPLSGQNSGESLISAGLTIAGAVATVATGGVAAPAIIGGTTGALGSLADAMTGQSVSTGSSGSALTAEIYPFLDTAFYRIPGEDNSRNGRPLAEVRTPASLGGYMIAQKGAIEITGTLKEEEEIASFLTSGFYYE